jgi:hypothetical protein
MFQSGFVLLAISGLLRTAERFIYVGLHSDELFQWNKRRLASSGTRKRLAFSFSKTQSLAFGTISWWYFKRRSLSSRPFEPLRVSPAPECIQLPLLYRVVVVPVSGCL